MMSKFESTTLESFFRENVDYLLHILDVWRRKQTNIVTDFAFHPVATNRFEQHDFSTGLKVKNQI